MIKPEGLAPETHNSEQDDEPGQAQTVAAEAMAQRRQGSGESTKGGKGIEGASGQDLVDHMREMERSGHIDMGAFRGEPSMDDEDDTYGDPKKRDA